MNQVVLPSLHGADARRGYAAGLFDRIFLEFDRHDEECDVTRLIGVLLWIEYQ